MAADSVACLTRWAIADEDTCPLWHFDVLDVRGHTVGVVAGAWPDGSAACRSSLAVRLNWQVAALSIIPATDVLIDHTMATVRVAYTEEQIKQFPRLPLQASGPVLN